MTERFDEYDDEPLESIEARMFARYAEMTPSYVGVAIWWVISLGLVALGGFIVHALVSGSVSSDPLPIVMILVLCAGGLVFTVPLTRWTRDIARRRRKRADG